METVGSVKEMLGELIVEFLFWWGFMYYFPLPLRIKTTTIIGRETHTSNSNHYGFIDAMMFLSMED